MKSKPCTIDSAKLLQGASLKSVLSYLPLNIDTYIDQAIPQSTTTTVLLGELGKVLEGTQYDRKLKKKHEEEEEEELEDEDEEMEDVSSAGEEDSGSSDDEESSSEEDENSSSEDDDDESSSSDDDDESSNKDPWKHDGSPVTLEHVKYMTKKQLTKSLSHFGLARFNRKEFTNDHRRQQLNQIIQNKDNHNSGPRERAKLRIYQVLTANSPTPVDEQASAVYSHYIADLGCSPHVGKSTVAAHSRAHSKKNPLLMLIHKEECVEWLDLHKEIQDERKKYPEQQKKDKEAAVMKAYDEGKAAIHQNRNKRKRTKNNSVVLNETRARDQHLTSHRKKLKKKLIAAIKKQTAIQKKRHLTKEQLDLFAPLGRDMLIYAYTIKLAMTTKFGDPAPSLIKKDTLDDSFLKMDVRRITRFADCYEFFLALAKGKWNGQPIPYTILGVSPPTPDQRLSFLGMAKFANLIDIIYVQCMMSYQTASFEKLEAAEAAAAELLLWHLQFDPRMTGNDCFGACISRLQIQHIFGILRIFRRLLTQAEAMGENSKFNFNIKFGRLCNSYVEGRFSIFRTAVGNSALDGASITWQWRSMLAREARGMVNLGIERKDYKGLRLHVEKKQVELGNE